MQITILFYKNKKIFLFLLIFAKYLKYFEKSILLSKIVVYLYSKIIKNE